MLLKTAIKRLSYFRVLSLFRPRAERPFTLAASLQSLRVTRDAHWLFLAPFGGALLTRNMQNFGRIARNLKGALRMGEDSGLTLRRASDEGKMRYDVTPV